MLIKALCDYYDILARNKKIPPDGYSFVNIHYIICLTTDGKIDTIIDCRNRLISQMANGKEKEEWVPRTEVMPLRTEKTAVDSNIIEHRPIYIFGLNMVNGCLTLQDQTGKAKISHEAFVKANLSFIEGLNSPVINAFRNFLQTWRPKEETENALLLQIGRRYREYGFTFCLTGYPNEPLHMDLQIQRKWDQIFSTSPTGEGFVSQNAISGEIEEIARIHKKIKGIYGSHNNSSVLIGFNNSSEQSYANEQSYNSNISQSVMKKYTVALNYLTSGSKHKILLDDVTIVFWAAGPGESYAEAIKAMLCGQSDKMNAAETELMLKNMMESGKWGKITKERLQPLHSINEDVDFYLVGLKPNVSRISIKFIFHRKFADLLWNLARFQEDMQIVGQLKPISFSQIKEELLSPQTTVKTNPAILTKLFEAALRRLSMEPSIHMHFWRQQFGG